MMDSFYDQPRDAPKPTNINKLGTSPLIPDVSMIQSPSTANVNSHNLCAADSYNVWKARCFSDSRAGTKENNSQLANTSILRKQVKFENPIMHTNNSTNFKRFHSKNNLKSKPFEQVYMANIPNRNLDLSMIEPLKQVRKDSFEDSKDCFDIYNYKGFYELNNQGNLSSRELCDELKDNFQKPNGCDTFFPKNKFSNEYDKFFPSIINERLPSRENKMEFHPSMSKEISQKQNTDDPTIKDLLKVIQQQNEQILILQKQVACLLETKSNQKQIEPPNQNKDQNHFRKPNKGPLSKFAIDVMTSFEVSVRPQQNARNKFMKEVDSPKIQEITDGSNDEAGALGNILDGIKEHDRGVEAVHEIDEVSLNLTEPLKVVERSQSPEQSIHVDMQDYSSSDEEDSSSSSDLGWTLYNNIMDQVNNIFKNAQGNLVKCDGVKNTTLKKVKEATMKHLQSIGVNLPLADENETSEREDEDNKTEYSPTQISFAVKQLLMKYLPNEQLAKVTYEPKQIQTENTKTSGDLIKRRPEFSFATVQYMKKYNLLASDNQHEKKPPRQKRISQKILDVTALKQQPKLL